MLSTKPIDQWREIEEAERIRDTRIKQLDDILEAYSGPSFHSKAKVGDPENSSYEYISLWVSRAVAGNPRVQIGTARKASQRVTARALEHAMNRQIRDTRLKETLVSWAHDFAFSWCVGLTVMEERKLSGWEWDDPVQGPRTYRIDPKHFFCDPQALSRTECRFFGHDYPVDLDDAIQEAKDSPDEGWRMDALRQLSEEIDRDRDRNELSQTKRGEVTFREFYVPELDLADVEGDFDPSGEFTPEEGYNGVIFTLDKNGSWVRDPRAYYGPRGGPYSWWGAYEVPGEPYPLSPLVATDQQRKDLNAHAIANNRAHDRRKRLGVYDRASTNDARTLKNARDGEFVGVQGLDRSKVIELELGGVTDQGMMAEAQKRDRLHRMQGMSDAKRGGPRPDVTATADAIADESDTARMAYLLGRFQDGVVNVLSKWAWIDYHEEDVILPMPDEALAEGFQPWFYGGDGRKTMKDLIRRSAPNVDVTDEQLDALLPAMEEEGSGATFDDLELEIEFYSMARMTQAMAMRQATMVMEVAANSAPMVVQNPQVDWQTLYDMVGRTIHLPALGDILNPKLARKMFGLQQAMALKEAQGPQGEGQPMIGRSAGLYGSMPQAGQRSPQDMEGSQTGPQAASMAGVA